MCHKLFIANHSTQAGVFVFDTPREYRIFRYDWGETRPHVDRLESLHKFESDRHRFARKIQEVLSADLFENVESDVAEYVLMTMACENYLGFLSALDDTLDEIDMDMAINNIVQKQIESWRKIFGVCKVYLSHIDEACGPIESFAKAKLHQKSNLALRFPETVTGAQNGDGRSIDNEPWAVLEKQIFTVRTKSRMELKRVESSFAAAMSTMATIESEMAINEAIEVSKLTKLAFFFIPLTFVASVCGMNLAVSIHNRT